MRGGIVESDGRRGRPHTIFNTHQGVPRVIEPTRGLVNAPSSFNRYTFLGVIFGGAHGGQFREGAFQCRGVDGVVGLLVCKVVDLFPGTAFHLGQFGAVLKVFRRREGFVLRVKIGAKRREAICRGFGASGVLVRHSPNVWRVLFQKQVLQYK